MLEMEELAKELALPVIVKDGKVYIKEGTLLGITRGEKEDPPVNYKELSDKELDEHIELGNYLRIIMRDEVNDAVIEDIEEYMEIERGETANASQPYQAQEGDLEILAHVICHEGCASSGEPSTYTPEQVTDAARAIGYVVINRALLNYGGHGTTIEDQIRAPGQYDGGAHYVDEANTCTRTCDNCIAAAEWCLTYDSTSISNPEGIPMPRNVVGQSGWCQCSNDIGKFNCWWIVDFVEDGKPSEAASNGIPPPPWDHFFCINSKFPEK